MTRCTEIVGRADGFRTVTEDCGRELPCKIHPTTSSGDAPNWLPGEKPSDLMPFYEQLRMMARTMPDGSFRKYIEEAAQQLAAITKALREIKAITRNVNTRRSQRSKRIHQLAAAALTSLEGERKS